MSITELKAAVYDNIAQKEACDRNITAFNEEIVRKMRESKPELPNISV